MTADRKERGATARRAGTGKDAKRSQTPDQHVANALRSAYEETVQENVPAEFLDLLGKLS